MKWIFAVFVLVGVFGCESINSKSNREVASTQNAIYSYDAEKDYAQIHDEFSKISKGQTTSFDARLDQIVEGYLRAHLLTLEFDKNLKAEAAAFKPESKESDILTSPTYVKLMAVWAIRRSLEGKVAEIYRRAFQDRVEKQDLVAGEILSRIHRKFRHLSDDQKLMLHDLNRELSEILGEYVGRAKAKAQASASLQILESAKLQKVGTVASNPEVKSKILDAAQKIESTGVTEVSQAIDEVEKKIKEDLEETKNTGVTPADGRNPSSEPFGLKIYPDVGPNGNLTGRTFAENHWALTFDDGPSAKSTHTPLLIQILKSMGVKATFFMLGKNVEMYPTTAQAVRDTEPGHLIAEHSYSHLQLTKVNSATLHKEIVDAKGIIEAGLSLGSGNHPLIYFFRLPYGAGMSNLEIRTMIKEQNMVHVFWNVDTLDWQDKDPNSILARTLDQMKVQKNRGIILFHDIHDQSVKAAKLLLENKRNVKWVTMDEEVRERNGEP